MGKIIRKIKSMDDWGVRSLSFNDTVIGIGSASGDLSFYDLTADQWLNLSLDSSKNRTSIQCTTGSVQLIDEYYPSIYADNFVNSSKQAIYSHCFSPSLCKLFIGGKLPRKIIRNFLENSLGGPILLGFRGCYGSVLL